MLFSNFTKNSEHFYGSLYYVVACIKFTIKKNINSVKTNLLDTIKANIDKLIYNRNTDITVL